jgi:hypothetical protein
VNKTTKFKQICVGQYRGASGLSFVVIGLGIDGKVYKFLMENGWERIEKSRERALEAREDVFDDEQIWGND